MNLRRLTRTCSTAMLTALILAPAVASAQHGGHAGGAHLGGGMHAGSGPAMAHPSMSEGYPMGHEQPSMHQGYGVGYLGWGVGGWGIGGQDAFGTMGMSPMDQEMVKQARYMEIVMRAQMQQMQAVQAYEQANLARRQSMMLARAQASEAPPETESAPMPGLGRLVALDRVRWPVALPQSDRGLIARQEEAENLLIDVHNQALTDGHAEKELVSAAKEKLRLLRDSAARNTRLKSGGRQKLARFIGELDLALDRSLRRPDPGALEKAREGDNQPGRRLAANR